MATRPPTQLELEAAFRASRDSSWPGTFEEAMRDPILAQLVTLRARAAAATAWRPPSHRRRPLADFKRLACGERDD